MCPSSHTDTLLPRHISFVDYSIAIHLNKRFIRLVRSIELHCNFMKSIAKHFSEGLHVRIWKGTLIVTIVVVMFQSVERAHKFDYLQETSKRIVQVSIWMLRKDARFPSCQDWSRNKPRSRECDVKSNLRHERKSFETINYSKFAKRPCSNLDTHTFDQWAKVQFSYVSSIHNFHMSMQTRRIGLI